jgi:hypothetical protein
LGIIFCASGNTPGIMPIHHLMIGTWTPPGAIFTVQFDDEDLTLRLIKRTEIENPISWMTFSAGPHPNALVQVQTPLIRAK